MIQKDQKSRIDVDVGEDVTKRWKEAAIRAGIDLSVFNPQATLPDRIKWALASGLMISTFYGRFSTKLQASVPDQARACAQYAAAHQMYLPPEYCFCDEATGGRKLRREGLDLVKDVLRQRQANVLVVFKVSRLFRQPYQGFQFFQQELVEEGLRGISISQGIDTADMRSWKPLMQLHGMMDDLLLDAIGDHVREGLKGIFNQGHTVGALPVGYKRIEVPGAPPTKLGKPRTMPGVDGDVADMIRQHFTWIRDGMTISQGLRRWVNAGGPCDPRSSTGRMSYSAYHRMLLNPCYIGRWEFGRKKNQWSSKRDYTLQTTQSADKVQVRQVDELRIVSDELFLEVQQRLSALISGPRGPRQPKKLELWDVVVDCFVCPRCNGDRYYIAGANGLGMRCKHGVLCPLTSNVNRREAVLAVCDVLAKRLQSDRTLVCEAIAKARTMGGDGDAALAKENVDLDRKIRQLAGKLDDLHDLAGTGSDVDRAETKAKILSARSERDTLTHRQIQVRKALNGTVSAVTDESLKAAMAEIHDVMVAAARGDLGDEGVMKAARIFRAMTGGRIEVHVDQRAGRERTTVRGVFQLQLVDSIAQSMGMNIPMELGTGDPAKEDVSPQRAEVWLRELPRMDRIASEVRRLYEEEGLGFRTISKLLGIGCGNIYQSYLRYYQMQGLSAPPRRPRGRSRS